MNFSIILGLGAGLLAIGSAIVLAMHFLGSSESSSYKSLMKGSSSQNSSGIDQRLAKDDMDFEHIKEQTRKANESSGPSKKMTFDEKLFAAGVFTKREKAKFERMKMLAPVVCGPLFGAVIGLMAGLDLGLAGIVLGTLAGFQLPSTILDRRAKARQEDIMFYLPLVVEQISIGVSSSLDIGPCLQRVVQMADERDTHNVVTELLRHVQYHVKSGMGLEEALTDIGRLSGSMELKHTFVNLSQVAKHGGEISKQLQELADAVSSQRETKIEAKIKKLELEATGPVALVFMGFMIILLIGFGLQIQGALS
jgi:Flp pilus assembly protein TadB